MAPTIRSFQVSATPFMIFAHLLAIGVTTLLLLWLLHFREGFAFNSDDKLKIFNLHPFLMVIGLILFGGEAIMAYKAVPAKRKAQKGVHVMLHLLALLAGILGTSVIFKFKHESVGALNMKTLHSWLGIITISLYGLQWVFAFFAYCFPGAERIAKATLLPWHIFFGMVIFFFAILTAETGLAQTFIFFVKRLNSEGYIVNSTGLLILLYAISVTLTVILPRRY